MLVDYCISTFFWNLLKKVTPLLLLLINSCSEVTQDELEEIRLKNITDEISFKGKGREQIRNHLLNELKIEEQCKRGFKYFPQSNDLEGYELRESKKLKWEWFGNQLHELQYRHVMYYKDSKEYPENITYVCRTEYASENSVSFNIKLSYEPNCLGWTPEIDSDFSYYLDEDEFNFWGAEYWDDYEKNFFSNACK